MDFLKVVSQVTSQLDASKVRYALIGGFAMSLRGVQRSTVDLDFILMLEDLATAHTILEKHGYERAFHSENVSHYTSSNIDFGRIDILHAFRGPTLGMLKRAERISIGLGYNLPVVSIEDIIGLKVQAMANDPKRIPRDQSDIQMILETAGETKLNIDWQLIQDYLELFEESAQLERYRIWYGATL